MEFQFPLDVADYEAFARYVARPGGEAMRRMRWSRITVPLVILVLMLPDLLSGDGLSGMDWVFLGLAAGWYVYTPISFANRMATRIRQVAATGLPRGNFGLQKLVVDADGITLSHDFGSTHRHWAGIEELVDQPEHLFIMFGPSVGFIVPKSWLGESVDELRDVILRAKAESPTR